MGADASNGLSSLLRGGGVERGRNSSFSNETFESKKDGYSANSYRAVLEDLVLPNDTAGLFSCKIMLQSAQLKRLRFG
jgi:hypothetical protein